MRIRSILNLIAFLLFAILCFAFLFRLYFSPSVFSELKFYQNRTISVNSRNDVLINSPLIQDSNYIWCIAKSQKNTKSFLLKFSIPEGTSEVIQYFDEHTPVLYGFTKDSLQNRLFLFNNNTVLSYTIIKKNGTIQSASTNLNLDKIKILGVGLQKEQLQLVISEDDKKLTLFSHNNDFSNNDTAQIGELYYKIGQPLCAYQDAHEEWTIVFMSNYFKKDEKYLPLSKNQSNFLFFSPQSTFPIQSKLINDPIKLSEINIVVSGLFKVPEYLNDKIFMIDKNRTITAIPCSRTVFSQNTFNFSENTLSRSDIKVYRVQDTLYYKLPISKADTLTLKINAIRHGKFTDLTIQNTKKQHLKIRSLYDFKNLYLFSYSSDILLLTENGNYCIFSDALSRIDSISFFQKVKTLLSENIENISKLKLTYNNLSVFLILIFFPVSSVFAICIYMIKAIFFTKKRPSYSKRKSKKSKFQSFLLPGAIIYLLIGLVFITGFIQFLLIL